MKRNNQTRQVDADEFSKLKSQKIVQEIDLISLSQQSKMIPAFDPFKTYQSPTNNIQGKEQDQEKSIESQMQNLQKSSKNDESTKVGNQSIEILSKLNRLSDEAESIEELSIIEIPKKISVINSTCKSLDIDSKKLSSQGLIQDQRCQENSNYELIEIKPEEREFYEIVLAQFKGFPSAQSIHKNLDVKDLITKVGTLNNDTVKIEELIDCYSHVIKGFSASKFYIDLHILKLLKKALDTYLKHLIANILQEDPKVNQKNRQQKKIFKYNHQAKENTIALKNQNIAQKSQNIQESFVSINNKKQKIDSQQINSFQINQMKITDKRNQLVPVSTNSFASLTDQQLMKLNMSQELQVNFYNQRYIANPQNSYYTSSTTKEITIEEKVLIRKMLNNNFEALNINKRNARMLNIPSGNGRLNSVFSEYFKIIDCIDPCEQAVKLVENQKETGNFSDQIGSISQMTIQNWTFDPNNTYDLIWCNYGFSFLNGNEALAFLENAKKSLKPNGYLIIKDVIAEEKCAGVYFKEQERIFRSLENYKATFQKSFIIKRFETFVPKDPAGISLRSEGIFLLSKGSIKTIQYKFKP